MWDIIGLIASVLSLICVIYSEIQFKQCEKHLDEVNRLIDEQQGDISKDG